MASVLDAEGAVAGGGQQHQVFRLRMQKCIFKCRDSTFHATRTSSLAWSVLYLRILRAVRRGHHLRPDTPAAAADGANGLAQTGQVSLALEPVPKAAAVDVVAPLVVRCVAVVEVLAGAVVVLGAQAGEGAVLYGGE